MKYYVYTHSLDGNVFYVGKGTGGRKYFSHRNEQWKQIVGNRKKDIKVKIVREFDVEEMAYEFEELLTMEYKSRGLCQANISIGKKHSEASKRKIRERSMGLKNSMFRKKFSSEHKRKLSDSRKGARNHLFGKSGADHSSSKPAVAIFPDGRLIEASSQKELAETLEEKYGMTLSMVKHSMKTGKPYKARNEKLKNLDGMMIKYICI